jgi:DNA anti-recombination protein RmuC
VPIHTGSVDGEQEVDELRQLRESVIILTAQCAQLDEANRAWQQYHQTQLDSFRNKLVDQLPIDENRSLDEIGQQIIDQMNKEREHFSEKCAELEKANVDLRSGSRYITYLFY